MKKINKKLLGVGVIVLFFSVALVFLVKAQVGGEYFFRVNSASTTPAGAKDANNRLITIINRSGKDYFVPNKTPAEFESFKNNAPNYVGVSVCGDLVCGDGETAATCPEDCFAPGSEVEYCGNGVCDERWVESTSTQTISVPNKDKLCQGLGGWFYNVYRDAYFLVTGDMLSNRCSATEETIQTRTYTREGNETWETCPDDCSPSILSGCGICGYNGDGDLCPNFCNGGTMNLVNCERSAPLDIMMVSAYKQLALKNKNIADYFLIASALAQNNPQINWIDNTVDYRFDFGWKCSTSAGTPCPAGKYCYPNGLSVSGEVNCPAGKFCPAGSSFPRDCPPGTYSLAGSSTCTKCLAGFSAPRSTSIEACYSVYRVRDGVCRTAYENPVNSPHDCPDSLSRDSGSSQAIFYGDGRCTGVESAIPTSPYYSLDCWCGNGSCDNNESVASCYGDCYFCGDGICDSSESYATCSSDCSCGNNICEPIKGEFYSPTSAPGSCNNDCRCGNGTCEPQAPYNETWQTCFSDCHCGNGWCEPSLGEKRSNCIDCSCGDNVCDPDEVNRGDIYPCPTDCHCGIDANGDGSFCDSAPPYNETASNCPSDCEGTINNPQIPEAIN